jgi:hypothetical protein
MNCNNGDRANKRVVMRTKLYVLVVTISLILQMVVQMLFGD